MLASAVVVYLRPIAPIATGYAAKTICSGVFVSGRAPEDVEGDLPDNPLVPLLRTSVDRDEGSVRATLLGAAASTAWFTEGLGCTLADARPSFEPVTAIADAVDLPTSIAPGVMAAIESAFTEDDPDGRLRRTRAVVVLHDGEVVAERYADGFDAGTPLLGWSMGKSLANAMVGRLVAEGVLSLDDTGLLAAWEDDARADIHLDDLLRMTSGLEFEEVYDPDTDATNMLFLPGDTGAFAADKPLVAEPGTSWSYSSGSTNILCDVAQRGAGGDVSLARDLVFDPIGMTSAVIEPDSSGGLVCSSFPYATARDWARFGQWFLQEGEWEGVQLLPPDWVAYTTTPVQLETEHPYGASWWLNTDHTGRTRMPSVPADAYWASGNEGQQVVVIPSRDLVVVRLGLTADFDGIDWGLETLLVGVLDALGG